MSNKPRFEEYQVIIKSPPGANPADFTITLLNPIRLDSHKIYDISLKNAILSASWDTGPLGTAFQVDGVDKIIPSGHWTFASLSKYVEEYFILKALPYSGMSEVTPVEDKVITLRSIASLIGFNEGITLQTGVTLQSTSKVSIGKYSFLSVSCSLVDIESTRSNYQVRPNLRTSLIPDCLEAYQIFDLMDGNDSYGVKATAGIIDSIDIRIADGNGNAISLDFSIPTYFTFKIREIGANGYMS